MKKRAIVLLLPVFALLVFQYWAFLQRYDHDIVIYGGGLGGCAAAISAAATDNDASILLIMPESLPGGLGTVGGQNFFDIRRWQGKLVSGGSFGRWFDKLGHFYGTDEAIQLLQQELADYPNITVMYNTDIAQVRKSGKAINSIYVSKVAPDDRGVLLFTKGSERVRGRVYIDASEDGRFSRLAGVPLISGRADWPSSLLPEDEADTERQQVATLMFKISGVVLPPHPGVFGDLGFSRDHRNNWGIWGGSATYANDPVVTAFNEKYGKQGFAIKPFNIAQDGKNSDEWWVNTLLIFNVDGRAKLRDAGTATYPSDQREDYLDADTAYLAAREFLNNPDFWEALRRFTYTDSERGQVYGLQNVVPVRDENGNVESGVSLYIRETVHMLTTPEAVGEAGTEDTYFALAPGETQFAGAVRGEGGDTANYESRIGLAFYAMDINAYKPEDLVMDGTFIWPVTKKVRPEWVVAGGEPQNPVYLPYEMLITESAENLLVPGYATSASSFAWAELRVLPNLTVLGDAAGIAAAIAVKKELAPFDFKQEEITELQKQLVNYGAILDKEKL